MENIDLHISNWILEYSKKNNVNSLVVGISGGIDSALTSSLCAETGINTKLLIMPILQNEAETIRGINHIESLKQKYSNIEDVNIDLTNIYNKYLDEIPRKFQTKLSLANTRARIRMTTLYMVAGSCNGIVVGTGNKIEDFGVGFFTKYGDGGVDISPIADCTKTEVRELGKELKVLEEIIKAQPTDGLWEDGRTDEKQLGLTYEQVEEAMSNSNSKNRLKYEEIRKLNLHKMELIPVCKIPK